MSIKYLYLIAVAAILGCAPASGTSGALPARQATLLTAEEMTAANADVATLYDAISRLRPSWLTSRGTTFNPRANEFPVVFVDGHLYGELDSLRNIYASQVAAVRYYSSTEAGGKFGSQGGTSGVIEVRRK
jgi:hypothetical protein